MKEYGTVVLHIIKRKNPLWFDFQKLDQYTGGIWFIQTPQGQPVAKPVAPL